MTHDTCGSLRPYWVNGAIAARPCRAYPSEGDAKAMLTTGLRWSAKGPNSGATSCGPCSKESNPPISQEGGPSEDRQPRGNASHSHLQLKRRKLRIVT